MYMQPLLEGFTLAPLVKRGPTKIVEPFQGNGCNYEAAEVMRCLRAGELESKTMPLDETLSIMETMDAIRGGWCGGRPQVEMG